MFWKISEALPPSSGQFRCYPVEKLDNVQIYTCGRSQPEPSKLANRRGRVEKLSRRRMYTHSSTVRSFDVRIGGCREETDTAEWN